MRPDYSLMLKQLQRELEGMDAKRRALEAAIASLERLVQADDLQLTLTDLGVERPRKATATNGIPPGFFKGKTPTEAYRDLMKLWPSDYAPTQIADALEAGGIGMPRTRLIQAVHSVLKREKKKAARNGGGGTGG